LLCITQRTDNQIYREFKKLNSLKINEPIKKWATELNRTFSKEEIQMAKKHMKKCSPCLAIKEMQMKTTLRFLLTPVRIAIIKNTITTRCWRGCGEKGTLIHCWWECKLVQLLWKKIWRFLKNLNICHMIQQSHSWGYTQRNATQVTPEAPGHPCLLQCYSQ
jgi:hypothetical protein